MGEGEASGKNNEGAAEGVRGTGVGEVGRGVVTQEVKIENATMARVPWRVLRQYGYRSYERLGFDYVNALEFVTVNSFFINLFLPHLAIGQSSFNFSIISMQETLIF